MEKKIALLPGDGIGQEVAPQAVKVLKALERRLRFDRGDFVGGDDAGP